MQLFTSEINLGQDVSNSTNRDTRPDQMTAWRQNCCTSYLHYIYIVTSHFIQQSKTDVIIMISEAIWFRNKPIHDNDLLTGRGLKILKRNALQNVFTTSVFLSVSSGFLSFDVKGYNTYYQCSQPLLKTNQPSYLKDT